MKTRSSLRTFAARGFTLIEVVIVLGIIAILAAFLAPTAFEGIQSSRETATKKQVERIFLAIVGEPSKGNFGYLGDMGRLPANLAELVTQGDPAQGGQVGYHTSDSGTAHKGNVGTGWRGPYVTGTDATDDLFKDAWGLALTYTAGQIVSGGPDGQIAPPNAGDNITYPVQLPVQTTGTIVVTVVVNDIPQPINVTVTVYSTVNGEQVAATPQTTPNPSVDGKPFRFTVPQGTSAIVSLHVSGATEVTRTTTVDMAAGTQLSRTVLMKTSATVPM